MAHSIDLKNTSIRTDIIIESFNHDKNIEGINHKILKKSENILIEETKITEEGEIYCGKKKGLYTTISFDDITDKENFSMVLGNFVDVFNGYLNNIKFNSNSKVLVIGLGNEESTPDSLGPEVINNILVTSYLFEFGQVEEGYTDVAAFKPSVMGVTGIETSDLVSGIVNVHKPDFLIVIDALAASSINRVNKTIQVSDAGILPGSGVGNNRKEFSKDIFGLDVISIGVPTVVDASVLVSDTLKFMLKQFGYRLENIDNNKFKFVSIENQNYFNTSKELSSSEKEKVLGLIGTLDEKEMKKLIDEVLTPIGYNMMVTPKEIDFVLKKLALLIGKGINKCLHSSYNVTN